MKISKKKLIQYCFLLYVFLVLSLPDGIKNMTCLYKMSTRDLPLVFTYNYYFSILELPIILFGLNVYRGSGIIRFLKLFAVVFAINLIFVVAGEEMNVVSIHSYEMFLLLLTGFSAASILLWVADDLYEFERLIDFFIIFQFLLVIVSILSGASGKGGRYSAIGMGSGATAGLSASYLVWTLFSRESKTWRVPIVCALITIVLSGSRVNMFAFLFIVLVFSGRLIHRQILQGNTKKVILVLTFGVPVVAALVYYAYQAGVFGTLDRYLNLIQGNFVTNVTNDSSYIGRIRSFAGGWAILKNHSFGIPFSIYAIEYYSANTFSMEYPHSTLMSYILLWSPPVALFCACYLIRLLVRSVKNHNDDWIYLLYYLVMATLYGSPVLYSKSYAFTLAIISYIAIKNRKEESIDPELTKQHII